MARAAAATASPMGAAWSEVSAIVMASAAKVMATAAGAASTAASTAAAAMRALEGCRRPAARQGCARDQRVGKRTASRCHLPSRRGCDLSSPSGWKLSCRGSACR